MTVLPDLPPFPTDHVTLAQLEHALNTSIEIVRESWRRVGGDYTLSDLLDRMSGYDPATRTPTRRQHYSDHDVIRALVGRIRELEAKSV